jgi:hypothetical protein
MERRSASPAERVSAAWVADRLREAGVADVRVEPYTFQSTYAAAHAVHFAAGLLALKRGSRTLAAAALASFELEYSGRSQWLRRLLPAGEGANVVGRLPARGKVQRTLVLVAHHDAAHTGLAWSPALLRPGDARAARTGRRASLALLPEVALAVAAIGPSRFRRAAAGVLAASLALVADVARGSVVPGANDNASGVAALLALVERLAHEPVRGLEVLAVVPGGEEAGMGGMSAWLAGARSALDADRTVVVGLDTVGSGEPVVLTAEGGLWPVRYDAEDVALAVRAAAAAGVPLRHWRLGAWTDPVLARVAGLRAISLLSVRDGGFPNYHLPTDTPDAVDLDCVERCGEAAFAIAVEWART